MPKVLLEKKGQPADLDDAVAAKVDASVDYYAGTVEALQSKVEDLVSIVGVLAKVINEAGLMGAEDIAEIIGYAYKVKYDGE